MHVSWGIDLLDSEYAPLGAQVGIPCHDSVAKRKCEHECLKEQHPQKVQAWHMR